MNRKHLMEHQKQNSNLSTNNTISLNLVPIDEVLQKGTIFSELYEPYKIIPPKPIAENEQERLLHELQTYAIAGMDLNLFLDVYPDNREGIKLFNMIRERKNEAVKNYEDKYGPIQISSNSLNGVPWPWNMSSWPWEDENQ